MAISGGLWQTPTRARHGQLLLRSPGSGVRHRRLSTAATDAPGPKAPGVSSFPGSDGHQHPKDTPMSTMTASPAAPVAVTGNDVERIGELRSAIDACDAEIIELVQRRLAISQEIGALRAASGGTRLSLSREQQVLSRFRAALGPDGAALGMMLLRQGRGHL
jgi:chorismate mutase